MEAYTSGPQQLPDVQQVKALQVGKSPVQMGDARAWS